MIEMNCCCNVRAMVEIHCPILYCRLVRLHGDLKMDQQTLRVGKYSYCLNTL